MRNIFTICYSEEEANEVATLFWVEDTKVFRMIVTDIAVKRFGGLSLKPEGIIQITSMLVLEVARWSYLGIKSGFAETVLNILRRNGCSMNC